MSNNLKSSVVTITGGTGSFGSTMLKRLLSIGCDEIRIFSRDENKQDTLRNSILDERVKFFIGDVRDRDSVSKAIRGSDYVFHAAALKQVPSCEFFPMQAIATNVNGSFNVIDASFEHSVKSVVCLSTDKAVYPINVMGMTKAIQERLFIRANLDCPDTRFICVRYGNVLASRGSVIPLFHEQIRQGGPITITTKDMTRFLLSLDQAVDTIFAAIKDGYKGETYIPNVPSAKMTDLANVMIGDRPIKTEITGIRPGEKTHEILVSEEEAYRTIPRNGYYVILPILPELRRNDAENNYLSKEYSSADYLMSEQDLQSMLNQYQLLNIDPLDSPKELLR
jgi:UDP-glucose 4-epimerase